MRQQSSFSFFSSLDSIHTNIGEGEMGRKATQGHKGGRHKGIGANGERYPGITRLNRFPAKRAGKTGVIGGPKYYT